MSRQLSPFFDIGFHGDQFLLEIVATTARRSSQFIETGANVGSTLCYFARQYPKIRCWSCEPDDAACAFAQKQAASLSNARIHHEASPQFLHTLAKKDPKILQRADTTFWLDSHGYGFKWPLREEVEFITNRFPAGYMFIDDFKVPGQPQFEFDEYDGQVCSFETVGDSLKRGVNYTIYYPRYKEKTSQHHPLKGWVLIEFGQPSPLELSAGLREKVTLTPYVR